MKPTQIYFLCTGNSCRSQIAEGLAQDLFKEQAKIYSAGLFAYGVNPMAIKILKEVGIDISHNESKEIDPVILHSSDYVITLCDHARDQCPVIPKSVRHIHWSIVDPAGASGTTEQVMSLFRSVRDDIKQRLLDFKTETTKK